jgi:hypothetical protein
VSSRSPRAVPRRARATQLSTQVLVRGLSSFLAAANRLWNLKVVRIFQTERDRSVVRESFDYRYLQRKIEWPTKCLQNGVDGLILALINGGRRVGSVDRNSIEVLWCSAAWNRGDCDRSEVRAASADLWITSAHFDHLLISSFS